MTTTATTAFYDEGYNRKRKPWLVYPLFCWVATAILFPLFKGGNGQGSMDNGQHLMGFNTTVPTAENTSIKQQEIDQPAYGGRIGGQVLSDITNTQKIPAANQLQNFPGDEQAAANPTYTTTATSAQNAAPSAPTAPNTYSAPTTQAKVRKGQNYAQQPGFKYHRAQPYYVNSNQTDQQLEQQLSTYQSARDYGQKVAEPAPAAEVAHTTESRAKTPDFIQLADNSKTSRLDQGAPSPVAENPFNTAPVGQNRQQEVVSTLQSTGHNKQTVTALIPAVVHDDQSVKAGQTVKLRLTKAVMVNSIRVPANTIVHATCKPNGDRILLFVQSMQMNGQLIPLNLEAVDVDGGEGMNAPGLSDQLSGQLKSSAMQGGNIPTGSMLVSSVLNAARFGASSSMRQTTIHLKGGYQLYLKSI